MPEVIRRASIVIVCGIIHVLSMSLSIGVMLEREIGIIREEQTVPCPFLLALLILLVAERLIVSLESSTLSNIEAPLWDHSREGFQVRARIPGVALLVFMECRVGEKDSSKDACSEEVKSELLSC
jgi:hypothetical protein